MRNRIIDTTPTAPPAATLKWIGGVVLLLATIVRLVFISTTPIIDDEAYYFDWTRHLAWGYIDGGPTIAYVMKPCVLLFGANGFGVRIGAVLLTTAAALYLWRWGARRFTPLTGFLLMLLVTVTPICFVSSIVHTYDTEMAVCLLAALAMYHDAYFVDRRWFYPAGLLLGLALLSKISVLFPAVGIAAAPFLIPRLRGILRSPAFYLSFLIAATVLIPFICWNVATDFAFIRFKGGMAYRHGDFGDFADVWLAQAGLFLPIVFWLALSLPFRALAHWRRGKANDADIFFALAAVVPILYFGIGSYFSRYYGNWVAPAFFGGLFLTAIHAGRAWPRLRTAVVVHAALSATLLAAVILQVYTGFLPLSPAADVTSRYHVYPGLMPQVDAYLHAHPELRGLRLTANTYQIPAMLNYYLRPEPEAVGLSLGGSAYYHESMYSMLYPGKTLAGQDLLFLFQGQYPDPKLVATLDNRYAALDPELMPYFDGAEPLQTFQVKRKGQPIATMTMWRVRNFKGR